MDSAKVEAKKWFDDNNERRIELIEQQSWAGLTDIEATELADLQTVAERMLDQFEQLPLAELKALKDSIMNKADSNQTKET